MAYYDQIHPLHHTVVNAPLSDGTLIRVILTVDGRFQPLVEYFSAGRNLKKSISWQNKIAQAVGYLIDYMVQVGSVYQGDPKGLFSDFAKDLLTGTIDINGNDPRGLYWPKLSWQTVNNALYGLFEFNKWCHDEYGAKLLVPTKDLNWGERIAKYHALDMKNKNSFFKHLKDAKSTWESSGTSSRPNYGESILISPRRPAFFPPDKFEELLFKGYLRPGVKGHPELDERNVHKYFNTRDIMISILQGAGGLRESEPFHLFIDDVEEDPSKPGHALVKVRHPAEGLYYYEDPITGKTIQRKRSDYLRMNGLLPRDISRVKNYRAGWKDPMLETDRKRDLFMRVFFFPQYWGEVFYKLYRNYIMYARPRNTKHPFLFVSMDDMYFGEPYSVTAYSKNHNAAVRRIGIEPCQAEGTSTHGLRRLYGHKLQICEVPRRLRQECLHQKSIMSQDPYTLPTVAQINRVLQKAASEIDLIDEELKKAGGLIAPVQLPF